MTRPWLHSWVVAAAAAPRLSNPVVEAPARARAPSQVPDAIAGGRQGKLPVTAFEAFDLEARTWTRHPSLPSRRAFAGCAMAEGHVFSLGGLQQPGPHNFYSRPHFVNTVETFDLERGEQGGPGCPLAVEAPGACPDRPSLPCRLLDQAAPRPAHEG